MRNAEIAAAIDELGILYELDGANRFRVLAYKDAAKAIRASSAPVGELALAGRATELSGIGDTIQEKIVALVRDGEIPARAKLAAKFPATLVQITRLPGVGSKTARRIYDETGIATLGELKAAAEAEQLRDIKGLGEKFEQNVIEAAERMRVDGASERRLLSDVLTIAGELIRALSESDASEQVALAGSARRWADTCKDIDIVATAGEPLTLAKELAAHPLIAQCGNPTRNGLHGRTHNDIPFDLRIVPPENFGNLLQHFTGSKEHNVKLRERAVKMGLSVSEHGITETESGEVTRCATEDEVYDRLGLAYIEPELREARGEIALAEKGELPELVTLADIKGDLHCHTTLSDGKNNVREMAEAAKDRGYSYLAVTDHSASHGFGNDVQADALLRRVEEVRELNASGELGRFKVLVGSEVNIGTDGTLDYEDDVLEQLDWVIAGVHTSFRMSKQKMTARMVAAIEHPLSDCISHPTGRLLLRRDPYEIDIEAVIEAAARTGTLLEINGNPNRRDLNDEHARMAADAGVMIAIDTDAHRAERLAIMPFGVATARRAGLTKEQIANTRPLGRLMKLRPRTG